MELDPTPMREHLEALLAWALHRDSEPAPPPAGDGVVGEGVVSEGGGVGEEHGDDYSDNELDRDDQAERCADEYEASLFNRKRGGRCARSTAATKLSHKLDAKQRRAVRCAMVPHRDKDVLGLRRDFREPVVTFTAPGCEGGQFFQQRLARALVVASARHRAHWRESSRAASSAAPRAEQDRIAAAVPFAITQYIHAPICPITVPSFCLYRFVFAPFIPLAHHGRHEPRLIHSASAQSALEAALAAIQHRDLTPEDYELLLRLDEAVKAKCVLNNLLIYVPIPFFWKYMYAYVHT
jgi:hypothetical protein